MKHQVSTAVRCPYYKCHERSEIFCRGFQEGTSIHMAFAIPLEKKLYMEKHCKSFAGCGQCLIARALEEAGR